MKEEGIFCLFTERSDNEGVFFCLQRDLIMRKFLCLQRDPMSRNRFPQVNLDYNLLTNQSLYNDFNLNQGNQGLSMEVMTLTLSLLTSPNPFKFWPVSHFSLHCSIVQCWWVLCLCIDEAKYHIMHRSLTSIHTILYIWKWVNGPKCETVKHL